MIIAGVHPETVAVIAVTSSGLLAGQMLAIALANQAERAQPGPEWIRRFQLENRLFTKTMIPSLVLPRS